MLPSTDDTRVRISSESAEPLFHSSRLRPRWQFDGAVWTLTASETVPTLSEQDTVRILGDRFVDEHGRMRLAARVGAGWWRFLTKLLGPGARALVEGSTERSHPSACRLRAALQWRLAIVCVPGKVVSKVLYAPPNSVFCRCRSTGCTQGCHLLRAMCIGRKGDSRAFSSLAAGSYR